MCFVVFKLKVVVLRSSKSLEPLKVFWSLIINRLRESKIRLGSQSFNEDSLIKILHGFRGPFLEKGSSFFNFFSRFSLSTCGFSQREVPGQKGLGEIFHF